MPNVRSAKKRMKTSEAHRARNRAYRSTLKTHMKKVLASKEPKEAAALLGRAVSFIDKTAGKGVIHKNTASRLKSRLMAHIDKLPT